jgi:hypothetical protein
MRVQQTRHKKAGDTLAVLADKPLECFLFYDPKDVTGKFICNADEARGHSTSFVVFFREPSVYEEQVIAASLMDSNDMACYMDRKPQLLRTRFEILNS